MHQCRHRGRERWPTICFGFTVRQLHGLRQTRRNRNMAQIAKSSLRPRTSGILIQPKNEAAIVLEAAIEATTGLSAHLGAESAGDLTVAIGSKPRETN